MKQDTGVAYRISLEAIFYDDNLTNQQKMVAYRKLLPLYPQCEKGLQGLIADLQGT